MVSGAKVSKSLQMQRLAREDYFEAEPGGARVPPRKAKRPDASDETRAGLPGKARRPNAPAKRKFIADFPPNVSFYLYFCVTIKAKETEYGNKQI